MRLRTWLASLTWGVFLIWIIGDVLIVALGTVVWGAQTIHVLSFLATQSTDVLVIPWLTSDPTPYFLAWFIGGLLLTLVLGMISNALVFSEPS